MDLKPEDLDAILSDPRVTGEILKVVLSNVDVMEDLLREISQELEQSLDRNPAYRRRFMNTVMANPEFRGRVVREIVLRWERRTAGL